jgi:hypothetical protein
MIGKESVKGFSVKSSREMTYARLSVWRFKKGQQQIGLKALSDDYLPKIKAMKGYRGHLHLIDEKDPDTMVLVTMCDEDEGALNLKKELFNKVSNELEEYFQITPDLTMYKVKSAEMLSQLPTPKGVGL